MDPNRHSSQDTPPYQDRKIERFLTRVNFYFHAHAQEEHLGDVANPKLTSADEIDAFLEMYYFEGNAKQPVDDITATDLILRGYSPRRVMNMMRNPRKSPDDAAVRVSKAIGRLLAELHEGRRVFAPLESRGTTKAEDTSDLLATAQSLDNQIKILFEQELLTNHEAAILLHHLGFITAAASQRAVDTLYRVTAARLLAPKRRSTTIPVRQQHLPEARIYTRKMLESRLSVAQLAVLPGSKYQEEMITKLLSVGLRELLDPSFD